MVTTIKFLATDVAPKPDEVDYWVDIADNPYKGTIKYFNGVDWIRLQDLGGNFDLINYYTRNEVNSLLNEKASVSSVESKLDDGEVSKLIKNINVDSATNELKLVSTNYDGSTVVLNIPIADNGHAGILTSDKYKDLVTLSDKLALYVELYAVAEGIRQAYQPKLTAGNNIVISNNTISTSSDLLIDWTKILNKPTFSNVSKSGNYNDLINKLTAGNGITISEDNVITATVDISSIQTALSNKADKSTTYTKTEVDQKITTAVDNIETVTSVSELTDVTLTNILSNQYLKWDGTKWVNAEVAGNISGDVPIATTETAGKVKIGTGLSIDANGVLVPSVDFETISFNGEGLLLVIGGTGTVIERYNVRTYNNLSDSNLLISKGSPCILNFTFVSQEKYGAEEPYVNTNERGLCTISIKNSLYQDYQEVKQVYVNSANPTELDISDLIIAGTNSILVKIVGEVTKIAASALIYNVTVTTLTVSADTFKWWLPYSEDIIVPFMIAGNITKLLKIRVTGTDYDLSYEIPLGSAIYMETPYNFIMPRPTNEGVYTMTAYVSNIDGKLTTKNIVINFLVIEKDSQNKYFYINNPISKINNYRDNNIFDYAIYDGSGGYSNLFFRISKDGTLIYESNNSTTITQNKSTFTYSPEIEANGVSEFNVVLSVVDGNENILLNPMTYTVDNSRSYPSVAGAAFYMNPKSRNNSQINSKQIINEVDGSSINTTWSNLNWGNDGWQPLDKCLRLIAGGSANILYYPFLTEIARRGITIEFDYLVDNVTNFKEPVIQICSDEESFTGLKITPENITFLSLTLKNLIDQSIHTDTGQRIRMTLVVMPTAYGNNNFNLCIIYINGKKNREFTYASNDYFLNNGSIRIGSTSADIDIYGIRIYDSVLTSAQVLQNYVNWLSDITTKDLIVADNDVLDDLGYDIDFFNTLDLYNVLVFTNTLPSYSDPNSKVGDLYVYFNKSPERNVHITNVTAAGQGTSSKKYFRWNTKYKIDKSLSVINYASGLTGKTKWAMTSDLPAAAAFTAKKNYASPMQSHKMGSVNSILDLYHQLDMHNEAMLTPTYSNARVTVYQEPFVMFTKSVDEEGNDVYAFLGEYTFGPDKGDKYTFGYDTALFPRLISIEGSDNAPLPTLFRIPWNNNIFYDSTTEAFTYNGANCWDFDGGNIANIDLFIPAYNLAYQCSNRIVPFSGTVADLNSDIITYKLTGYDYWIAKKDDPNLYNVYYYDAITNSFIGSDIGAGTINLKTQLASYLPEDLSTFDDNTLNQMFINARIQKFRDEASNYWDIDDAIFHRNWVEFHAGTDQRAKNTYPYCFGDGCKWKWRFDDMDTIFDTDNQGKPLKEYFVEFYDEGIWNGVTSNFWNLIELAFPEEIKLKMATFLRAMEALSPVQTGDSYNKLMGYFTKYYLNSSQYFPAAIVNADTKYSYETAKMNPLYTADVDPMTLALGDHYSAESAWISKRINYMMSKYSFGNFSANGTDTIVVRAAGNIINYNLTPAIDLYPNIANGTSIVRGPRTKANQEVIMEIDLGGSADQLNIIEGASWYRSIGNWHDKNVKGTMTILGKRLLELNLGSKTEPITIAISSLDIKPTCKSLLKIDLSNISTLTGVLDVSECTHLQELYASGTALTQLVLPKGSIQYVEFPLSTQYLLLNNYPLLTLEGLVLGSAINNITDLWISSCPSLSPVKIMNNIVSALSSQGTNHKLRRIRLTSFDETYDSAEGATLLDNLAKITDGSYVGLDSEGLELLNSYPVLDGSITVNGNAYEDSINSLRNKFPKLILNISGLYYIRFQDSEVERISAPIWGDGTGTSRTMAAKSITFSSNNLPFRGNTTIEYFNEFELFENTLYFNGNPNYVGFFEGCTNLKEIRLPLNIVNTATSPNSPDADMMFRNCTNLKKVYFPEGSLYIRGGMFENCQRIILDNLPDTITGCAALKSSFIFFFRAPLGCTYAPNPLACTIPHFVLQRNTTLLGSSFIHQCDVRYMYCMATVPPTLASWSGKPYGALYVPIGSGDLYKTATNWSTVANITYEYDFNKLLDTTRGTDLSFLLEKGKVDVPIYSFTSDKITSVSNDTSIVEVDSNTLIPKKVGTTSVKFTCGSLELTKNVTIYDNYVDAIVSSYIYYRENRVKFNTGVVPTTNTKIEFSCAPLTSSLILFGCQNTDNTGRFYVSYGASPNPTFISFYDSTYTGVTGGTIGTDVLITLTPTTCTIGGSTRTYTRTTYPTTPIWIFDYADSGNYISNINFHYMKIYEGETLIHHYVPLKSGDMYDIIENKLLSALW